MYIIIPEKKFSLSFILWINLLVVEVWAIIEFNLNIKVFFSQDHAL